MIEIAEARAADEHLAAGKAHDVIELAAAEIDAHRHCDRAEALQGEEHERKLDPVGQLDGHNVTWPDAERTQPRGHAIDCVRERAVAEPMHPVGQRLALGHLARAACKHRR